MFFKKWRKKVKSNIEKQDEEKDVSNSSGYVLSDDQLVKVKQHFKSRGPVEKSETKEQKTQSPKLWAEDQSSDQPSQSKQRFQFLSYIHSGFGSMRSNFQKPQVNLYHIPYFLRIKRLFAGLNALLFLIAGGMLLLSLNVLGLYFLGVSFLCVDYLAKTRGK